VGSNTPHVWKSAPEHYKDNELRVECLVLFIPDQLPLFDLQELTPIKRLLKDSKRGIHFPAAVVPKLSEKLKVIYNTNGMARLMNVLDLLHFMANLKNTSYLSTPQLSTEHDKRDFDRLSQCIDFLLRKYDQKIELQTMADLANMTPNSFCRYFKQRTTKTFSQYLTELRINKASRLLVDSDWNIHQIAFSCGFNSISNFNQHFRRLKNMNPGEYRNNFVGIF
jgi:AraC-like DNA-binding protein